MADNNICLFDSVGPRGLQILRKSSDGSATPLVLKKNTEMLEEERKMNGSAVEGRSFGGLDYTVDLQSEGFSSVRVLASCRREGAADRSVTETVLSYVACL